MTDDRHASSLEIRPLRVAAERYDVAILGGGLAGLTLAIQLKRQRPETTVAVLEKREGPAPSAAFKVGESTVPSGAYYFAAKVGMEDHLSEEQLVKCGLRFFLPADGNKDITKRVEHGSDRYPPHDNYQIDRGLFENELAARARSLGVDVLQGCRVQEVEFGDDLHEVTFTQMDADVATKARWVVDAAGRASLLKRRLGLGKDVDHTINSAWLRLAGGLDIEDWGRDNSEWMDKMSERGLRQFSTNHLMGEGYWVWLIPLRSGPISIGVCADPRIHPFEEMSELDGMIAWLKRHEPPLGEAVDARRDDVEDFLRVQDFAYGVERVFSPERWALVGEAGAFADPFYSPGSDFIGYGNLFTGDLITRDLDGEDISERLEYYNDFYLRTFDYVLSKYDDQYLIFGNVWVAAHKLFWDAFFNHTGVVLMMVKDKIPDYEFMRSVDDELTRLYRLSMNMQELFKQWHELEQRPDENPIIRQGAGTLVRGFVGLVRPMDDEELREEIREEIRVAEAWAVTLFAIACEALEERPDLDRPINPYAVSLRPERWEDDGLYEEPGIKVDDAREQALAAGPPGGMGPPPGAGGPPPGAAGGPPPGVAVGPPPGDAGPPSSG
jgi:flavin-dependent dehydrogenase